MKGMKIGIDFGSSSLKIYAEGKGIVVDEPSIVAVETETGKPIAFGKAADSVYGRTVDDIKVVKVIRNGVISDFVLAERMLRYYLQRVCGNRIYKPNVIISLLSDISALEKKTYLDVVTLAGAGRVCMVEGILASAFGSGVATDKIGGRMVIDIGHNVTEYAIVSMGSISVSGTIRRGSDEIDKAIIKHLKRDRDIVIDPHTAREIKYKISSALKRECETALMVSGKSNLDEMPISFEITSNEVFPYVDEQINMLVKDIHSHYPSAGYRTINDILLSTHGLMICDISVLKSMQRLNIRGYVRKPKHTAINQGSEHSVFPNILNRNFKADKPMQKIVTDVTYIENKGKWYYFSRNSR